MIADITRSQALQLQTRFREDPEFFFREFLGIQLWQKQVEIALSVRDHRKTSVRSCHGSGKTFDASAIVLWYLISHTDSKVITTAPTATQVRNVLWREIRTRFNRALYPVGGVCNTMDLQIGTEWFALGISTTEPDRFQGYHAEHLLTVVDEAAGVDEPIYEGVNAITSAAKNRVLLIGNPTSLGGTFYDSQRSTVYNKLKISCWDTPNFTINNITDVDSLFEAIDSGRPLKEYNPKLIAPVYVYEEIKNWGLDSPVVQARCFGDFPTESENTLIPLNKIELAMSADRRALVARDESTIRYGVDPARFGSDKTAIAERFGDYVEAVRVHSKEDTMQTVGRVNQYLTDTPNSQAFIDTIGIGAGVYDRLMELRDVPIEEDGVAWRKVFSVNVAEKAKDSERFFNKRAEIYWTLRLKFERNEISLPNDPELLAELAQIQYKFKNGKLIIEEKDEIKKRTGRSPDRADALMLSYAAPTSGSFVMGSLTEHDVEFSPDQREEVSPTAGLLDKHF